MKLKFIAAAALAALLGSSAASAGEDVGWYVLGSVGAANADSDLHDDTVKETREATNDLADKGISSSVSVTTDETDFSFKLGMGYRFNDYFAVEGAYYYLGNHKTKVSGTVSGNGVTGNVHARYEAKGHMLALDAVGIIPLNDRFELFGKAGVGVVQTRVSGSYDWSAASYGDSDSFSKHKTRLAPKLGVGAEWFFMENWALRAEYERVWNASKDGDGTIDIDYNIFTVGVKYLF